MQNKKVFVTVGTTSFDKLIEQAHSEAVLKKLEGMDFNEIILQIGNGNVCPRLQSMTSTGISLKYVRFLSDFISTVRKSDLVISHAGAGTCLEVLRCGKPLIVVVNEDLMDNHQLELAEQLQNDSYIYYCNYTQLESTLDKDLSHLKKYPKPSSHLFRDYLNKAMGFT